MIAVDPGSRRVCDAKCYGATGKVCTCICRGVLHGLGRADAVTAARLAGLVLAPASAGAR